MKIFELKKPVLDKIETVVNEYLASLDPQPTREFKFLYLDFEPDDGYIHSVDYDGAVCVYAPEIRFPEGSGSTTGTQDSTSVLVVDSYGFGNPIKEDQNPDTYHPTTREAENRAQVLTTLSYKAIMDRQENEGSPEVPQNYGTTIGIDERFPQSIQKFPDVGAMDDLRGVCAFRSMYKFKMGEDATEEALGADYAGPDEITTDTFFSGDEPE